MKFLKFFTSTTILILVVLLSLPATPQTAFSQDGDDDSCVSIVEQALQSVGSACAELGRNEACYGHINVDATFREDIEAQFETNGDIVDVGDLQSLLTQAADPTGETWGVALVNLQADLPDDSEDNVTLVLFGDAEITSAVSDDPDSEFTAPMQAITLRSGQTDACEQAPDGLLIRSPEGQRARVMVNGVELTLSSATFITADANSDMGIQGLEGEIEVTAQGQTEMVTPGLISTVELDENFEPAAPPTEPEPVEPNVEFPFEVFSGVFPDAEPISGASNGGASGGLANVFNGAGYSFSYPDGWVAMDTPVPDMDLSAVIITNNAAMAGGIENEIQSVPADTAFVLVYQASDFAALLEGAISGSTGDEIVSSYTELFGFSDFIVSGPESVQIGPHTVTRAEINFDLSAAGGTDTGFHVVMYGFNSVVILEYVSSGETATFDPTVQEIIATFTFE